jgi:steroid 5-alpha reductase family enzyme
MGRLIESVVDAVVMAVMISGARACPLRASVLGCIGILWPAPVVAPASEGAAIAAADNAAATSAVAAKIWARRVSKGLPFRMA